MRTVEKLWKKFKLSDFKQQEVYVLLEDGSSVNFTWTAYKRDDKRGMFLLGTEHNGYFEIDLCQVYMYKVTDNVTGRVIEEWYNPDDA